MKKIFLSIVLIISLAVCACAAEKENYVGVLAQLNMTESEYEAFVLDGRRNVGWNFLSYGSERFRYYDSLSAMQLALNIGEIAQIQLPEVVAEYFVKSDVNSYTVSGVSQFKTTYFAMGFLEKKAALRDRFNEALKALKENGTLEKLVKDYIDNFKENGEKPIKFTKFNGAETIKVALTGDLPPIDFVAANGSPRGFNVAILAEIGRQLKINFEVYNIETVARAAALASGRVDVVFWYKGTKGSDLQPDIPKEVILSDSYYEWNKFLLVKMKKRGGK